jgi:DNA polymerase III delta prime subunit
MASLPSPANQPNNRRTDKPKVDIPYDRWPNRIKRAIQSFLTITLILSLLIPLILFLNAEPVALTAFLSGLGFVGQLLGFLIQAAFFIGFQFGLMFWFMGRAKLDVILPGDDNSVTFRDYYGQPKLVALVKQWMSLLRDRKAYEQMGGKYISGLLLYGPPGTGKTMLAKAVAGESGMPFVAIEGTGLLGVFLGMDILKVLQFTRKVKSLARKYGACVAYIDEIDAIGTSRGAVMRNRFEPSNGPNEPEKSGIHKVVAGMGMGGGMGSMALSTLLSQMDGVNEMTRGEKLRRRFLRTFGIDWKPKRDWHVMWMGSTNRPDVLDPALTRSGRMDTHIAVLPPDKASRRLVIEGYLRKIKVDETVDIESIVADTINVTPADIMTAITKNAVRIAFFAGRTLVSQKDIDQAFLELMHGMEMPIEEFSEDQRRVLAYHEAGHAVAQYYMMPEQKIVRVTIVRLSDGAFGHMAYTNTVEQHIRPLMHLAYGIIVSLAGRGAEKIYAGEAYASTGGDYPNVARRIEGLAFYGFFGPTTEIPGAEKSYLDKRVFTTYFEGMEQTTDMLLRRHWREVVAVAEEVLLKNTLSGKEVVELIEANQTADSLKEEQIIPKTLAALRAATMAEMRRISNGSAIGIGTNSGDGVVVINNGDGVYNAKPAEAPKSAQSQAATNNAPATTPQADANGPTVISSGLSDFQPPIVNGGTAPPDPEQKK